MGPSALAWSEVVKGTEKPAKPLTTPGAECERSGAPLGRRGQPWGVGGAWNSTHASPGALTWLRNTSLHSWGGPVQTSVVLPVESSKRDANSNRTHLLSPYYATVSVLKVLLD